MDDIGLLRFGVLGPLEVRKGDRVLPIGSAKQRAVLAVLVLRANHVVPAGELIDVVWGGHPPKTAGNAVSVYVAQLRKALGGYLVWRPPGYLLPVDPDQVDLRRFQRLLADAHAARAAGDWEQAVADLQRALALWRGPALADVASEVLQAVEVPRLEEQRIGALEERIELELELGRHRQVIGELEALATVHPLRERLRGLLMLALYRSGRQAEALSVYRKTRRSLVEELGIEPGPELRRLEQAILAADPSLEVPIRHPAEDGQGRAAPASRRTIPAQLPTDVAAFTGRGRQLHELDRLLAPDVETTAVVISAITGTAGVGKTALAVHWAHRVRDRFPDGQLYANLRATQGPQSDPGDVLASFLRALGVDGSAIPVAREEREGLYRTRLADRRVLVLLDDAANEAQVRPLLPGGSGAAVLVTSRAPLMGLDGAHLLTLEVFEQGEALQLLERLIGPQRIAAEPEAARTIVERCGRLPLAVRIAGAKLKLRGDLRLARLAERLADEQHRLDELRAGDLEVRASLGLSYQAQDEPARRAFRLLSQVDAPDFPAWAAAAALDADAGAAEALLAWLTDAHLIEPAGEDLAGQSRYRFHDLLRAFGRERAASEEAPAARRAALRRFLAAYLRRAERADAALKPGQAPPGQGEPAGRDPHGIGDASAALAWFGAERSSLLAAVQQAHASGNWGLAWRLAASLACFFEQRADWADWQRSHLLALDAARHAGDRRGEGIILFGLGVLDAEQARFDQALDHYRRSLAIFGKRDDRWWQAHALQRLGELHWEQAQLDQAVAALEQSVAIFRALGDRHGQAVALRSLALTFDHQGRYDDALTGYQACLAMFRELGDRLREAATLQNLGFLYREQGRLDAAQACYQQCLGMFREFGDRRFEATTLRSLGDVCCEQDRLHDALGWLEQSLALFRELGDRRFEALALRTLGDVHRKAGRHPQALACLQECLGSCRQLGDRRIEGYALRSIGDLLAEQHHLDDALDHYQRALTAFSELGLPLWQGRTLECIADAHTVRGDQPAAQQAWQQAATILARLGVPTAAEVRRGQRRTAGRS
jgi:DNA-binding SARP family transcriptional activator/predicted negative regulator of RcsB-dependent stress response